MFAWLILFRLVEDIENKMLPKPTATVIANVPSIFKQSIFLSKPTVQLNEFNRTSVLTAMKRTHQDMMTNNQNLLRFVRKFQRYFSSYKFHTTYLKLILGETFPLLMERRKR